MDFTAAEREFARLEALRRAGQLDEEAYRRELATLRVQDSARRTWMLQERTGRWHVWQDGAWQAQAPPGRPAAAATTPPTPPPPPARAQAVARASHVASAGAIEAPEPLGVNIFGFAVRLFLWAVISVVVIVLVATQGRSDLEVLLVLVGVALLALMWLLWSLTRSWTGVIEQVRVEEHSTVEEDGSTTYHRARYAYVRTSDGKVKRVKAKRGLGEGDRVYKRVGDLGPRRVKS